jgi:hypothetical protein
MDPNVDPSAVGCWNDLHTLEWWIRQRFQKTIDFGDPPRGVSIRELGEITQSLVQIVMSTEITNHELQQTLHAQSVEALQAAAARFAAASRSAVHA